MTAGSPTNRESCAVCGFAWDEVGLEEIPERVDEAIGRIVELFSAHDQRLVQRPSAAVWSPVEYGSHVRDVLLNLRDRLIVGLGEENPSPKPMYGTLRVERGMYRLDGPDDLAMDLTVAARLFSRTVTALSADDGERPIFYGWPRPATRTLRWVAAQALHEIEHHLSDIERIADS